VAFLSILCRPPRNVVRSAPTSLFAEALTRFRPRSLPHASPLSLRTSKGRGRGSGDKGFWGASEVRGV
jgi:hypothetical protein